MFTVSHFGGVYIAITLTAALRTYLRRCSENSYPKEFFAFSRKTSLAKSFKALWSKSLLSIVQTVKLTS